MSTEKLRVVQVGAGGRGSTHLQAMTECGAVDLVAISELDEKKLKEAGEKYGVKKLYSDMSEMIKKENPDFVNIVTPPTLRLSIVEPAIKAGAKAIGIEKPIALTPSESRKLVALGKDRLITVNTQYQWKPHWQKIWSLLAEKAIGDIRVIRASTRANVLEQGPHVLDLALKAASISGLPDPEWVLGNCHGVERFGKTPVPADTSATIGLGDARLFINHGPSAPAVPGESVIWFHIQVEIIGSKGKIWVTLNQNGSMWRDGKFEEISTNWGRNDGEAQRGLFVAVRDHLKGGDWRKFPTRIDVAGKISDIMFAVYASALGGGRIKLPCELPDDVVTRLENLPQ